MARLRKDFIDFTTKEFYEVIEESDEDVLVLGNEGFCFGSICRRCGDIKPRKAMYCYPVSLGEVDPYEMADELVAEFPDKEIICDHDAVFCGCRSGKCEEGDDDDGSDDD